MDAQFSLFALPSFLLLLLFLLPACRTSYYDAGEVDPAMLGYVSEGERGEISEARRLRDEAADALAVAKHEVELAENDLRIAVKRKDLAEAEQRRARQQVEEYAAEDRWEDEEDRAAQEPTGETGDDDVTQSEAREASVRRTAAEGSSEVQRAERAIDWRRAAIEAAEKKVDLAEARLKLAESRVELAKAEAVARSQAPRADEIDLEAFRREVRRHETEVRVAEIRHQAALDEMDLERDLMEGREPRERDSRQGEEALRERQWEREQEQRARNRQE